MKRHSPIMGAIWVFLFSLAVMGCQNESPTNNTQAANAVTVSPMNQAPLMIKPTIIDSLLGKVVQLVLPGKGATLQIRSTILTIRPGALQLPTLVTFSMWNVTPPRGLRDAPNRVFSFFPHGLLFGTPSTLVVPFAELGVTRQNAAGLACYYYNELTRKYERQPTTIDYNNEVFIVQLNHFSQYAFGRLNKN
jgi:hypothetical protein